MMTNRNAQNDTLKAYAIYTRVSTDEQSDKFGIDAQLHKCEAMATIKDWHPTRVFTDDGISGTKDRADRSGLNAMMTAAENGEIAGVIVSSLDRIGRQTRIVLDVVEHLTRCGVELVSCKESIDTTSPTGQFFLTIMAAMSQLERDNIVERTTAGRNARGRKDGEKGGRVPVGYQRQLVEGKATGRIIVDPVGAQLVRSIFARHINGLSYRKIADELNAQGITTQRGRNWSHKAISVIVRNRDKYEGGYRGESQEKWPVILASQ